MLVFIAAVSQVSIGLTPECNVKCKSTQNQGYTFIECFIQTPETSNCTLNVAELLSGNCNITFYHSLHLVCDNTHYRPILTIDLVNCVRFHGKLHIKMCGVLWQDLEQLGHVLFISELYLEDFNDRWDEELMETDYWKKYLDFRGKNKADTRDLQKQPDIPVIPFGLRWIITLAIVNTDHIAGILQEFFWDYLVNLVFINSQVSKVINSRFQTIFSNINRLEMTRCNLTEPPRLISGNNTSLLPGNMSVTEKFQNFGYHCKYYFYMQSLILDGNWITDLSNCTFKGNLAEISLKDNSLSRVNGNLFTLLPGLVSIDMSSNALSSLPEGLFWDLAKLSSVSLANNKLETIPQLLFILLPYLENVDLSANSLTVRYSLTFAEVPALKRLTLLQIKSVGIIVL